MFFSLDIHTLLVSVVTSNADSKRASLQAKRTNFSAARGWHTLPLAHFLLPDTIIRYEVSKKYITRNMTGG